MGVVVNPTGTIDIQDSSWGISRVDSSCAANTAFGNNGLQFYAMSSPSYQVEDIESAICGSTGILPAACAANNPHQGLRFIVDSDDTVYAGATLYCLNPDKTALGSDQHIAVTRISPSGIVDSTFGTNGIFSAAALSQGNIEGLNSLSLTPDHKLLMFATSSADINSANNWVLYRVK